MHFGRLSASRAQAARWLSTLAGRRAWPQRLIPWVPRRNESRRTLLQTQPEFDDGFSKGWHKPLHEHRRSFTHTCVCVLVAGSLTCCVFTYGISFCPAIGASMQPAIEGTGEILLFELVSAWLVPMMRSFTAHPERFFLYRWASVRQGDIVIAHPSEDADFVVCKRVVAKEGDVLLFPQGLETAPTQKQWVPPTFFLAEQTLGMENLKGLIGFQLPEKTVWLQGDNLADSCDSRDYGPVSEDKIIGRVLCKVWPPKHAKWFSRPAAIPNASTPMPQTQNLSLE